MVTTLTYTFSSLTLTPSPLNFGIFLNQVCSAAVKVVARGYEAVLVCFFYIYIFHAYADKSRFLLKNVRSYYFICSAACR